MVQQRVVIYSRVSTDAQERDGTSLDTQERACRAYAQAKGWVVAESIKDTASGANLDRPGIEPVRQLLRQGLWMSSWPMQWTGCREARYT